LAVALLCELVADQQRAMCVLESRSSSNIAALKRANDALNQRSEKVQRTVYGQQTMIESLEQTIADIQQRLTCDLSTFHGKNVRLLQTVGDQQGQILGCPTSGVGQRAMRETAPHARGVSKARQGNSKKVGCSQNPINCSDSFPCPRFREK
jgi:hypothetical protein